MEVQLKVAVKSGAVAISQRGGIGEVCLGLVCIIFIMWLVTEMIHKAVDRDYHWH